MPDCVYGSWRVAGLAVWSVGPAVLDAVAVFPAEAGSECGADGFVGVGGWWLSGWLVVYEVSGVVGVLGEAVQEPFGGAAGVFFGEAAVGAEEVFEGFVRSAF